MNDAYTPGMHVLADFHGVDPALLSDVIPLQTALKDAAAAAEASVIASHFHHFGPQMGVTGVLLLRESHISIHTWPETGLAVIDIFMCGHAQPKRALAALQHSLRPTRVVSQSIRRGAP
ncbi:adenosylmethionine decarboxylase [Silvimonas iriomotensis]|uniref:S-adenosylmethionine decarboxylase proenzyme n=1 Tax=Silvimonas iriomotensis TaxID=449662 RepID=A0ABQ2PEK3_9NEIS|nr:adenosylmethionine decarboxylase [Silvimonas iriomotensis]GGP23816.1 hypothetical protein GCM10010970_38160 [Silvimonas iriomotensis]